LITVSCPVIFCRGNHEGFGELEKLTGCSAFLAVDVFDRLRYLDRGEVIDIGGVRVAAVVGTPEGPKTVELPVCTPIVRAQTANQFRR